MNQEDKKLRDFLKSNESSVPEPNNFEFSRIKQAIEEDSKKRSWSQWMVWGPVALTLSCGLIFFASVNRSFESESSPVIQQADLEEVLFDSYAYLDELDEEFIEPYWM